MPDKTPQDPRELARSLAIAQVGTEMVSPLVIGVVVDYLLDTTPWAILAGIILGFVGGMAHLIILANKQNSELKGPPKNNGRGAGDGEKQSTRDP